MFVYFCPAFCRMQKVSEEIRANNQIKMYSTSFSANESYQRVTKANTSDNGIKKHTTHENQMEISKQGLFGEVNWPKLNAKQQNSSSGTPEKHKYYFWFRCNKMKKYFVDKLVNPVKGGKCTY